jgi:hypothetical protein
LGEFQKKKAHEDLLSALGNMGLRVSPDLKPAGGSNLAMGPGGTAPATLADIQAESPDYLPPAPAGPVPAEPLDPPAGD